RICVELTVLPQVDDPGDAVGDERPPAVVGELAHAIGADDRAEARHAAVVGGVPAEVTDVEAAVPGKPPLGRTHYAATSAVILPRSVVDVEPSIWTSTSSPWLAAPLKLTMVFRRVRPRSKLGSVRLGPSTRTPSTLPTRSALRSAAVRCTTSTS